MDFNDLKSFIKSIDIRTTYKCPTFSWPISNSSIFSWPISNSSIFSWPIYNSSIFSWQILSYLTIIFLAFFIIYYQISAIIKYHLFVTTSDNLINNSKAYFDNIIRQKLIIQINQLNQIISKYDNILDLCNLSGSANKSTNTNKSTNANKSTKKNIQIPSDYSEPIDRLYMILQLQSEKIDFLSKLSNGLTNDKTNMDLIINSLKSDNLHLKNLNEDLTKHNKKLQKDIEFLNPKPPILELKMSVSFDMEAIMKLMNESKNSKEKK